MFSNADRKKLFECYWGGGGGGGGGGGESQQGKDSFVARSTSMIN